MHSQVLACCMAIVACHQRAGCTMCTHACMRVDGGRRERMPCMWFVAWRRWLHRTVCVCSTRSCRVNDTSFKQAAHDELAMPNRPLRPWPPPSALHRHGGAAASRRPLALQLQEARLCLPLQRRQLLHILPYARQPRARLLAGAAAARLPIHRACQPRLRLQGQRRGQQQVLGESAAYTHDAAATAGASLEQCAHTAVRQGARAWMCGGSVMSSFSDGMGAPSRASTSLSSWGSSYLQRACGMRMHVCLAVCTTQCARGAAARAVVQERQCAGHALPQERRLRATQRHTAHAPHQVVWPPASLRRVLSASGASQGLAPLMVQNQTFSRTAATSEMARPMWSARPTRPTLRAQRAAHAGIGAPTRSACLHGPLAVHAAAAPPAAALALQRRASHLWM